MSLRRLGTGKLNSWALGSPRLFSIVNNLLSSLSTFNLLKCLNQWCPSFVQHENPLEVFLKHRLLASNPVSDLVGLRRGLRICICYSQVMMMLLVWRRHFENHWSGASMAPVLGRPAPLSGAPCPGICGFLCILVSIMSPHCQPSLPLLPGALLHLDN